MEDSRKSIREGLQGEEILEAVQCLGDVGVRAPSEWRNFNKYCGLLVEIPGALGIKTTA